MHRRTKVVVLAAVMLTAIFFIDYYFFMVQRVKQTTWEARGRADYMVLKKDPIGKGDYSVDGNVLTMLKGKSKNEQFMIRYCIFGNLWVSAKDGKEIAWYVSR